MVAGNLLLVIINAANNAPYNLTMSDNQSGSNGNWPDAGTDNNDPNKVGYRFRVAPTSGSMTIYVGTDGGAVWAALLVEIGPFDPAGDGVPVHGYLNGSPHSETPTATVFATDLIIAACACTSDNFATGFSYSDDFVGSHSNSSLGRQIQVQKRTTSVAGTQAAMTFTFGGGTSGSDARNTISILTIRGTSSGPTTKTLTASITLLGVRVLSVLGLRAAALIAAGSLRKAAAITRTSAATSAASVVRQARVVRSAAAASVASVRRAVSSTKAGATSSLATVATLKAKMLTLSATMASSASVQRAVSITRAAAAACSGGVARAVAKVFAVAQASSASITQTRLRMVTLAAAVAASGTVRRAVAVTRGAAAATQATVGKAIALTLRASAAGLGADLDAVLSQVTGWVHGNVNVWRVAARLRAWVVKKRGE